MTSESDRPPWWNDRIGVYMGKSWHIKSGWLNKRSSGRLVPATFCGQDGDVLWSPGINNWHPPGCRKCVKAFLGRAALAEVATTSAPPAHSGDSRTVDS